MSGADSPDLIALDDCGCCAGVSSQTPVEVFNRPGLSAIVHRVGTHPQFLNSMLARLSSTALPDSAGPVTAASSVLSALLRTRDSDDFSIALLDAWATVADVLTFYQERIANESYFRTATERRSLLELARLIGYELRPGVAASARLAFLLEEAPGSPRSTMIDAGTRVQSIPGPNEKPQTFESIEKIEARVAWNAIPAQATELVPPRLGQRTVCLKGTATDLRLGDCLLIVGDERAHDPQNENWDSRRVTEVRVDSKKDTTAVLLESGLGKPQRHVEPAKKHPRVFALRQRAAIFGHNAPDWGALQDSVKAAYLGLDPSQAHDPFPAEWPNFKIFAPAFPGEHDQPAPKRIIIPPSVSSVAEAIVAAAHAAATATAHRAAAAVAASALSAADVAQAAADTASTAVSAIEDVARAAATSVQAEAKSAIDTMISTLAGVQDAITTSAEAAADKSKRSIKKAVENADLPAVMGAVSGAASEGADAAVKAVLDKVKPEIDRMVQPIVDAAGAAAVAATGPAASLGALGNRARVFVERTKAAAVDAFATAAATASATAVVAVIKAIAADPDATVPGLEQAATKAANDAPMIARATAVAALSDPRLLIFAPMAREGAERAGKDVRDAVLEALRKALKGSWQMFPPRRPLPILTDHTIDLDNV